MPFLTNVLGIRRHVHRHVATHLRVNDRPLKLTARAGASIMGMGIAGGSESAGGQPFHVDLIVPEIHTGHQGPTRHALDTWIDGNLNYQVPR